MRSDQALRYLLLKHLWKLRSLAAPDLHAEVAKSLNVERIEGLYVVSWIRHNDPTRIECPADKFLFYKRGDDVTRPKETSLPSASSRDNEEAARQMAAAMLAVSLPLSEGKAVPPLYGDVWRWPLLWTVAAVACFVTSRTPLAFVLAGIAVLEPRLRTYWMYYPLVGAMIVEGSSISAVVVGIALAALTCLGSTTRRARVGALGYVILAYVGWHLRSHPHSALPEWSIFLPTIVIAAFVWTILWLSFEGPRLSILIAPLTAVSFLVDGHLDLALASLSVCLVYAGWLIVPTRLRQNAQP
jgi:hypothetical protein